MTWNEAFLFRLITNYCIGVQTSNLHNFLCEGEGTDLLYTNLGRNLREMIQQQVAVEYPRIQCVNKGEMPLLNTTGGVFLPSTSYILRVGLRGASNLLIQEQRKGIYGGTPPLICWDKHNPCEGDHHHLQRSSRR